MAHNVQGVLDASAVLAWLYQEPGGETISKVMKSCVIGASNMTEVLYRAAADGYQHPLPDLFNNLERGGLECVPNTPEDALLAAEIISNARPKGIGLSLGDGMCLALAVRLNVMTVTGDRAWEQLDLPIKVMPFR